jgi:hypothetical protein
MGIGVRSTGEGRVRDSRESVCVVHGRVGSARRAGRVVEPPEAERGTTKLAEVESAVGPPRAVAGGRSRSYPKLNPF